VQPKSAVKIFRRILKRKKLLAFGCLLWLALSGFSTAALAQVPPFKVARITITNIGPSAVSESLVRANIRVREGDTYNRLSIDDDVRNLYATGYFLNIRVAEERIDDGLALLYLLQGRPKITDLLYVGNRKYSKEKIAKKVTSKIGEPMDERKLFTDAQEIRKMYEKAGYPKTDVKYVLNIDERAGRGTVTFEVTEAPKIRIDDVVFEGATAFKQKKLRKVVKTHRHWWLSWLTRSGTLKEDQLEEDKDRLAEFFRDAGYIDFDVALQQVRTGPKKVALHFIVSEGRPYKVGAVGFNGVSLFPTNDVQKQLKMGVGQTFTPKGLGKDTEAVQDLYGTKGYIDARVGARKNANIETGTMDLAYHVEEGDKSYIEKIEIRGNSKTKDRVIRRELSVSPGEVFDMVKVKRSKQRLEGLNFFEKVETQPEPTDVPNRRNLIVQVAEKNTGSMSVGAGFTSIESLVGFVEVSQGNFDLFNPPNFTGAGQKIRLRAAIGTELQNYQITFIEPWFLGRKLEFTTDLFHRDLNFVSTSDTYSERDTGIRLGLRKALGSEFLIGGVSYTLEDVDIRLNNNLHGPLNVQVPGFPDVHHISPNVSPEIAAEARNLLISKVGASLAWDTRDSFLLPTKGQKSELRAELAGGIFGGDADYYKLEVSHARYIRGFAEGHLLELAARVGVGEAFGDSKDIPLFDRYFLGGLESLRGYRYRQIGPRDVFKEPLGGDTMWFGTAEYSIPIVERVRFAVFYDIGMVYRDPYEFKFSQYADNWGFGIRLNLPIGPLRLDYGVPIHNSVGRAGNGRFQFSVGYTRPF
jgi:outer membrane protein insertion porin family